jgi:hypothetical protein
MTLKYIEQIPHHLDPEVREAAVRIFEDSRAFFGRRTGNDTLKHCEEVAVRLVRTYTLMNNEGGREYALLYARVADLFGALWYYSGNAQRRIKYRALRADLYPAGAAS